MWLTEERLTLAIEKHARQCETCQNDEPCDGPDRIEAAFWNAVDWQIDDAKERRHERR